MELKKAPKGHTIRNNSNKVFNLLKKNSDGKYPPTCDIPEEDEVYMEWIDKDDKPQEGLRHIRYSTGEKSIFVDEQSTEAAKRRGTIRFTDGMLVVNEMEKTKLKYLEVCNYNKTNHENGTALTQRSPLFRTDAAKHEARIRLEKSNLKQKLKNIVSDFSNEELEGLALALNVPFPQAGDHMSDDEFATQVMLVRDRFNQMIEYDPNRFDKEVKSDKNRIKAIIGYALRDGIISYDHLDRTFYNEIGGKTKIMDVPSYSDKMEFFVEMATTRPTYKELYQDIKKLVEGGKKKADGSWKRTKAYKLLTRAIELKIVNNNFGTFVANNLGALGEETGGLQGATVYLQENMKSAYVELEKMVKEADKAGDKK